LISAPALSKHLTTSQCPRFDAANNCDCPRLLRKLISAPELSKHLTTSHPPLFVATFARYYDIVRLLEAHGALRKEIVEDSIALLNTCGYPEEKYVIQ
jgi:hypothetical protein